MESEDEIYSEFCYLSSSDSDDDSAFSYADLLSAIAEIGGLYQLSASSTYRVQHLKLPSISQKSTPCKFWMMGKCKRGFLISLTYFELQVITALFPTIVSSFLQIM